MSLPLQQTVDSLEQQKRPAHSRRLSCTRFVSETTKARKILMLANQSIRLQTVANRQKLLSASNELNMPKAKAKLVAKDVIVMSGPALESAACTLVYEL